MHRYSIGSILVVLSFSAGVIALVTNILAVSSEYWLLVDELVFVKDFELDFDIANISLTIPISTAMGLWQLCVVNGKYIPIF